MRTVTNFMRKSADRGLAINEEPSRFRRPFDDNFKLPSDMVDEEECKCNKCEGLVW